MLIDKKGVNNTFELSAEILFGTYITGWRWVEDEDNPPVAGDPYSNVLVINDEINILAHIQVLFRPDNTWMLMINFEPEISRSIVLNGEMGNTKYELLTDIYAKLAGATPVEMVGLVSIVHRLARAMYDHREVTKEKEVVELRPTDIVKYDSDIPRCSDLIPDPQHYSISRILDWIGRRLRLACTHNPYINVSQSDICMVLDSEFIGHGEHKIHVHDQKLIDALTSLGYIVEILDNLNAMDYIRISGWKTLETMKGGKENV